MVTLRCCIPPPVLQVVSLWIFMAVITLQEWELLACPYAHTSSLGTGLCSTFIWRHLHIVPFYHTCPSLSIHSFPFIWRGSMVGHQPGSCCRNANHVLLQNEPVRGSIQNVKCGWDRKAELQCICNPYKCFPFTHPYKNARFLRCKKNETKKNHFRIFFHLLMWPSIKNKRKSLKMEKTKVHKPTIM